MKTKALPVSSTLTMTETWAKGGQVSGHFLRPSRQIISFLIGLSLLLVTVGCGSSGVGSTGPPNPEPEIDAISPNSSQQGGPSFTLSVVGSNFTTNSAVHWNGATQSTTFVNANLLTAAIPAGEVAIPGPDNVTVGDIGGTSNALSLAVPCAIPAQGGSSQQTRARVGAYYFDGWSGPLTNFHFQGLPLGPFQDRQPLSGWQDNNQCAVEQQLAVAHNFGIDFFVFDWYFNSTVNEPGDDLNSALNITNQLADRHGMQYAILYVNSPPFVVAPADWPTAINQWIGYMGDPAYVTVNGKPLLIVIDMGNMRQTFGSSAGVASALNQLRTAAVASGLPGV
jgi:IPT/TIG domain